MGAEQCTTAPEALFQPSLVGVLSGGSTMLGRELNRGWGCSASKRGDRAGLKKLKLRMVDPPGRKVMLWRRAPVA